MEKDSLSVNDIIFIERFGEKFFLPKGKGLFILLERFLIEYKKKSVLITFEDFLRTIHCYDLEFTEALSLIRSEASLLKDYKKKFPKTADFISNALLHYVKKHPKVLRYE